MGAIASGSVLLPFRPAWTQGKIRSSGPESGALLIMGGGVRGLPIQEAALSLGRGTGSGPGKWVYIPTAGDDQEVAASQPPGFIARAGATSTTLHTRDRRVADSEAFTTPLLSATAVFFEGGRQWRLVDAYGGTRTEAALRTVLDRGGLISGTSAGATIQGSYLVRGDPAGSQILMSPGHERGFGYVRNAAIDQHVVARGREGDLAEVVAAHPGLLGVGIDQDTAVTVRKNLMTSLGPGFVLITDGARHDGRPYYALLPGTRFDLATWTIV